MPKRKILKAFIACLIIGAAYMAAPYAIKSYALKTYPIIKSIDHAAIHTNRISFSNVAIDNGKGLKASLDIINVYWNKKIEIIGGSIDYTFLKIKSEKPSVPKEKNNIIAKNLNIHVVYNNHSAIIFNASYNYNQICFDKIENKIINTTDGCLNIVDKTLFLSSAVAKLSLPFKIPSVESEQIISIKQIVANIPKRSVGIGSIDISDHELHSSAFNINATYLNGILKVKIPEAKTKHPWVAEKNSWAHIYDINLEYDKKNIIITQGKEIKIFADPINKQAKAEEASCWQWLSAIPETKPTVLNRLSESQVKGKFGFEISTDPPKIKITNTCKLECNNPIINELKKKFTYTIYSPDGKASERTTGPRTLGWVSANAIPSFIPRAFLIFEDPGFEHHRGIIVQALLNSFKLNLREGKFVRGGSTITMQLAKNIWLSRNRTITRKAQEILLASFLESCLSKSEILDLYINVVEFGPNVYGIGNAAMHYFKKDVGYLELIEAFYLARLLPHPNKAIPFDQGGEEETKKIMEIMVENNQIPKSMLTGDNSFGTFCPEEAWSGWEEFEDQ